MRLDFLYANPQLIPKIPFKMHFKTSKKQQNSSQNAKIFAARIETCLYQTCLANHDRENHHKGGHAYGGRCAIFSCDP